MIFYTRSLNFYPKHFIFKGDSDKKLVDRKVIGIYNDKDTCATGNIKLVGRKFIKKKIEKSYSKIEKVKKVDSVVKEQIKRKTSFREF